MRINFLGRKDPDAGSIADVQPEALLAVRLTPVEAAAKAAPYLAVVRWIVGIVIFLVPLFFLPWTSNILEVNKQILLVGCAGVALIVWLLGVIVSGRMRFRPTLLDGPVLAVLGATAVAAIFSLGWYRSVFGTSVGRSESLISIIAFTILYFAAVNVFDDYGNIIRKVLSASITIALAYGVLQMFGVFISPLAATATRAFTSAGSLNALGIAAAILLPLLITTRLRSERIPWLDGRPLGVLLAILILAVMNWWVLWLVAFAGLLAVIAWDSVAVTLARRKGEGFTMARFLVPMSVIVVGVFLLIVHFGFPAVKKHIPVEIAPNFSFSADVTRSVIQEDLMTGYGPEQFSLAFDRYGAARLANTNLSGAKFFDSTAQIFNFVVQGGLLMALAILFLFVSVGRALVRYRDAVRNHDSRTSEVSGIFASSVAALVAVCVYPFNVTLMLVLYALLVVLALAVSTEEPRVVSIEEKPTYSLASSLGFIVGLIGVLTGLYFISVNYAADAQYAQASRTKNNDAVIDRLTQAIGWNGNDDRYYRSLSQATLVQASQEINRPADAGDTQRTTRIQNALSSAIALAKRATEINPREADNWSNLATIYQNLLGLVQGVDKLAEDAYTQASQLRPGDPAFFNQIGSLYLIKADLVRQIARSAGAQADQLNQEADRSLGQAEQYFRKAIDAADSFGLAIYNLAIVYDRQGRINDSIKQLEKILPYNTDQPAILFELGLLYYRANRKNEAFGAFDRAVVLSPEFANARWYLALLYEERRDLPSAIAQLEKILETNKDNQTVLVKLQELQKGKTEIPPGKITDQKPLH